MSLIALAGLLACDGSDEDPSMQPDGSSGVVETEAGDPSSSGDPSPSTSSSTSAPSTGEPTTATTGPTPTGDSGTSGSSSESGTSGNDETSAGETAGDETAGHEGPSAECVELEACCDEIGSDLYNGCITVVQMESPALCDSILTTYHQEGYCTGETFCAELGDCCAELPPGPGWQDTCEYYADFGNQPQCAMLIGDYQLSDYCL